MKREHEETMKYRKIRRKRNQEKTERGRGKGE